MRIGVQHQVPNRQLDGGGLIGIAAQVCRAVGLEDVLDSGLVGNPESQVGVDEDVVGLPVRHLVEGIDAEGVESDGARVVGVGDIELSQQCVDGVAVEVDGRLRAVVKIVDRYTALAADNDGIADRNAADRRNDVAELAIGQCDGLGIGD